MSERQPDLKYKYPALIATLVNLSWESVKWLDFERYLQQGRLR